MAIEELRNIDSPGQGGSGFLMQTLVVLTVIIVVTFQIATQYTAHKLAYQDALGAPIFSISQFRFYEPFSYISWLLKYGNVEGTEEAFRGGEWILFTLHLLFVPAMFLAIKRGKKFNQKRDIHGSARFATKEEIVRSTLMQEDSVFSKKGKDEAGNGVYIGAWYDKEKNRYNYLTHAGPEHVMSIAPTRSGKGVGQVLPTLLSWKHSVFVHDIKGEAFALTAGYRKAIGQKILKFEPSNPDGSCARFNPLEEVRIKTMHEVADAQNVAQMIVDPDGKGMQDHWSKTGHEILSAAVVHLLYVSKNTTLRGLVSFFCDPCMNIEQVAESMLNATHDIDNTQNWVDPTTGRPTRTHPMVAESARSFLNKSENERSGVQSTAMSFLSLYRDPIVSKNTAVSDFKIRDLMNHDSPVSLYIIISPNEIDRLRPLTRLLINQIIRINTQKMDFADGRSTAGYKHRLLAMLDEFPALGKLEIFETALAFMAGYGIKSYLIIQDISQLEKAYTKDESITANCHIRAAYAPNTFATAKRISDMFGNLTVQTQTRSYSGSRLSPWLGHATAAVQDTQRALLTPDEVLALPGAQKSTDGKNIIAPGDMLIMPSGMRPIYGTQILYFKDPIFNGRSKIKPPAFSDRLREVNEITIIDDQADKEPVKEPVKEVELVDRYAHISPQSQQQTFTKSKNGYAVKEVDQAEVETEQQNLSEKSSETVESTIDVVNKTDAQSSASTVTSINSLLPKFSSFATQTTDDEDDEDSNNDEDEGDDDYDGSDKDVEERM